MNGEGIAAARPARRDGFVEFGSAEVEQSISDRFEQQVRENPKRSAIHSGDRHLSYEELNRAANAVARVLLERRGEGAEPIALLLGHGAQAMIAILGVLKAGKIYVPIDPFFPFSRNSYILEDSQATIILTDSKNLSLATSLAKGQQLINLDEIGLHAGGDNVGISVPADGLAYILSTSGSTGQPKGIVQTHRNVLSVVRRYTNGLELGADDRLTLLPSYSVTASVSNIFGALLNGACLYPFDVKDNGVTPLASWLGRHEITVYHSVPTLFRHFAGTLTVEQQFPNLRLIRLGGEPLYWRDVKLYREHFSPDCVLVNGYGSSEISNVWQYRIDRNTPIADGTVPVGYPIDDTTFTLIDDAGNALGTDCIGEITVKSRYLSPGYWHKPEVTAAVFGADPDGGDERIYRTGDLGYRLPDGCLVHVGRKDFQVKIRGFRVEVSETELALVELATVKETVVVAWDDGSEDKRLVAYVVPHPNEFPTASDMRAFLDKKLPEHMVPSTFILLDTLPLTPNGKLDRAALPAPELQRASGTNFVAPRSFEEEVIAKIWAEVLGLERVGINDNFFELGGHSLNATRITSRIAAEFQVALSLSTMLAFPTIAGLASVVSKSDRTRVEQSAILRNGFSTSPLSFSQQRLWVLDQLEPGRSTYNICEAMRIAGHLDPSALHEALDAIVGRHEVLHSTLISADGNPTQVTGRKAPVDLPVVDVSREPDPRAEAERLAIEESRRPFNLSQDVMLRASLLRLSPDEHILVIVVHHVAFDAWSANVFFQELASLYDAFAAGAASPLPELPFQYADFARWQRQRLQGELLDKQLSYWSRKLAGAPALLEIPTDRPRPAAQSFRGSSESLLLSPSLSESLKTLSRQQGVTLFMTLFAAFNVLLHRYTGQEDIVVGTPIAGRNRPELEDLLGFFVNSLVLRTRVSPDSTFRELLGAIAETAMEAYGNQDLPFEKLVDELQPERDLSRNPLFQVMFALQNVPGEGAKLRGLTLERLRLPKDNAKFDLFVAVEELPLGLNISAEYSTDLFDRQTIRRMLGHLEMLLESVVANPEQRISLLRLLTTSERRELLVEWNDTKADYPAALCAHQLFEAQAGRVPQATAVVCEEQRLTYDELNRRANQVAHFLLNKQGVGAESLVAICCDRSVEMVVAILGVLKSGAAYVPLDPAYPIERLDFIFKDASIPVVLSQTSQRAKLPSHGANVVCLDADWHEIARESDRNPTTQIDTENLAYIIYTSGSTGEPKGVQISHRALTNLVTSMGRRPGLTERDVLLAVTTISFDVAVLDTFMPLTVGGRVIVATSEDAIDPRKLLRVMAGEGATAMQATPSTWRMLLEAGWEGRPRLKVMSGGEALSAELANRLWQNCAAMWNMYGPTETTVYSCIHEIETGGSEVVPIGRPISNTQSYVLDAKLQPVPIGIPGDLYTGGDGLARGYLNRPELTDEKFIADPFSNEPRARMYKTGDRARYRSDGNLEYLGRIDDQVKIRGFRVEPGEIEVSLRKYPGMREAVVVAREDIPGDKRLVAYLVLDRESAAAAPALRSFLQRTLPEYMVPSLFVPLAELPRTPNGKIDRRALPAPDQGRAGSTNADRAAPEDSRGAPRNPREQKLASIWRDVLKLDFVGVRDNFFDIGGHSLLAVRAVSRMREAFQIELSVRNIFEKPTIAEMSEFIEGKTRLAAPGRPSA